MGLCFFNMICIVVLMDKEGGDIIIDRWVGAMLFSYGF